MLPGLLGSPKKQKYHDATSRGDPSSHFKWGRSQGTAPPYIRRGNGNDSKRSMNMFPADPRLQAHGKIKRKGTDSNGSDRNHLQNRKQYYRNKSIWGEFFISIGGVEGIF